ncbi:MAG: MFS transporter [Saccharolobus sp.]|uniref:Major facilitator superfamily (MFS) profile domain-containing protein n=1 Tax=Saccharolobus shibatae (strain ATCC 51178 / DSM 5389 / JCM 8931 / NBRC 15437 / B12) TaxID=523848 RepID=A0A8F5BPD4_SACSH|nr:MFS transporter [Saccharolobus shibatae]MCH4815834.1 MFS transporter [Saccharolobus shibatae]QXJ28914.1 hypothetical protein J5U23_01783 [Saccharolobus shibatae B12]
MGSKDVKSNRDRFIVTIAAVVGTLIDWYDFFIAATASATVWPIVFFSHLPTSIAAGLSIAAFGTTYLTRPIGAAVFGNYGDKLGRKSMMVITMVIMGIATFGIAFTPPTTSIGILAVILLFLWRIIFGIGLGGENTGATTWVIEFHHNSKYRAFWTSLVQTTAPIGISIASIVFSLVSASTGKNFVTFGWRIPFIAGGIALIVGILIRVIAFESPIFDQLLKKERLEKTPLLTLLKKYPKLVIKLAFIQNINLIGLTFLVEPYSLIYLGSLGIAREFSTFALFLGTVIGGIVPTFILGGILADKIGRKLVAFIAAIGLAIFTYPYFLLLSTRNSILIVIAMTLINVFIQMAFGVYGALGTEQFPTNVRYSGSALSYQLAAFIIGLFITFWEPFLISASHGIISATPFVSITASILSIISALLSLTLIETKGKDLSA